MLSSNLVDLFVFRELDKNYKKYDFSNAPRFFNKELPYKKEFIEAFKTFCKEYNLPIQINSENENEILINEVDYKVSIEVLFSTRTLLKNNFVWG